MFLNSFNYFRAIAIIYIVSAHTYWVANWEKKPLLYERFISIMVANGTVLFVFISGFLFYHVFYAKFRYFDFVYKKFKNVFVPFLILSTLPILYYLYIQSGPIDYFFFDRNEYGIWYQYIKPALLYYAFGYAQPPYWYMPFIMLTFLISPLHIKFIRMNTVAQSVILVVLLIISMLLHRPVNNLNPIQAVGYFSSAYFWGIYCSIHKEKIYKLLKGKDLFLLIPILGLAIFQILNFPKIHLYVKPAFELSYPDIIFLQKVFLCLFFMVFLHRFEGIYIKILDDIAKASFAIFFLHCFIIRFIEVVIESTKIDFDGNAIVWVIITTLIIYLSYLLALLIKKVLPTNKSRFFIGW
jgi:surface polysaccharide O-acyltransferase-like enzyme